MGTSSCATHVQVARAGTGDSASVEFALRRCYFHHDNDATKDSDPGFYLTLYVSGYGDDAPEAWQRWASR